MVEWDATTVNNPPTTLILAQISWEIGNHYAWGEMEPKQSYKENNYPYYQVIGNDISNTWHDAAQKELGVIGECQQKKNGMSYFFPPSMNGYLYMTVKGICLQQNGSHLFFPANGYAYDQNVDTPDEGYYWTSTFSNIDMDRKPVNGFSVSRSAPFTGPHTPGRAPRRKASREPVSSEPVATPPEPAPRRHCESDPPSGVVVLTPSSAVPRSGGAPAVARAPAA